MSRFSKTLVAIALAACATGVLADGKFAGVGRAAKPAASGIGRNPRQSRIVAGRCISATTSPPTPPATSAGKSPCPISTPRPTTIWNSGFAAMKWPATPRR